MKLSQAARLTDAVLVGPDLEFGAVATDTRALPPGALFVALRGERFDGHDFLRAAAAGGAVAAMVERDDDAFASYLRVADTRKGLGRLAAGWAAQCPARRVAVTGNAGKTTVKEMLACMLGDGVHATRGNLNNEIGVPLTLLGLRADHRFGVFELGASAAGEIAWTSALVGAEVGVITNVTGAHLEGFGSMQGIADAKAELFAGMPAGGTAVINGEGAFAAFFATRAREAGLRPVVVGGEHGSFFVTDVVVGRDDVRATLHAHGRRHALRVPLPGRHQVVNALLAIAAVDALGVPPEQAVARLEALPRVSGRMNLHACGGGTLVDDTYNANPGSVRAAIDWLAAQPAPRVLALGRLAELGPGAPEIYRELGEYARAAGLDDVLVTTDAAPLLDGFAGGRVMPRDDMPEPIRKLLAQGGTVLVKGSRSAGMEAVVRALLTTGEAD